MLKALVVNDSEGKLKDLSDVVQIGRCIARRAFRTSERVFIRKIWQVTELDCFVVLVEGPSVQKVSGVETGATNEK